MRKVRWEMVWFVFFTFCASSFAVLLMLQLTKTINISWWWVFAPAITMVAMPFLVVIIAAVIAVLKGDQEYGE